MIYKTILQNNANFDFLSPAEKRVQIAQDVLAQLACHEDQRKFTFQTGQYFHTFFNDAQLLSENTVELQQVVQNPDFHCTVCAIGALFVMKALNYNNCSVNSDLLIDEDIYIALDGIFDESMLNSIENAFECEVICNSIYDYDACIPAIMYAHVDDAKMRLKLIMENIITNNGDFKIPKLNELTNEQLDFFVKADNSTFLEDLDNEILAAAIKINQSKLDNLNRGDLVEIFRLLVGLRS